MIEIQRWDAGLIGGFEHGFGNAAFYALNFGQRIAHRRLVLKHLAVFQQDIVRFLTDEASAGAPPDLFFG